jgi:hypothetical protein
LLSRAISANSVWQQTLDALEDGVGASGELQLHQLLARRGPHRAHHQSGLKECLRLGGERQPSCHLGDVQWLDAERIARQCDCALHALMNGDRIHAAQMPCVVAAVAQPQVQWWLAVAVGGEVRPRHRCTHFAVIADYAIADERRWASEQRLVSGGNIDDR